MKILIPIITIAALVYLPAIGNSQPGYSKAEVKSMGRLVAKATQDHGVMFEIKHDVPVTEFHRKQAEALAETYQLTEVDIAQPVQIWGSHD